MGEIVHKKKIPGGIFSRDGFVIAEDFTQEELAATAQFI